MKCFIILAVLTLLWAAAVQGQYFKDVSFDVEAGIGFSVGSSTFATKTSAVNSFVMIHYDYKRFRLPMVRIRSSVLKSIHKAIRVGIKTGLDIHYFERNEYGAYETNFSVPMQIVSEVKTFSLNKNRAVYANIDLGYNFKNLDHVPFQEKGGILVSAGIAINRKADKRHHFYYKTGLEYAENGYYFHFTPPTENYKDETIRSTQKRRQVYIALGVNL